MKICCNMDQKITNTVINKQCRLDFLGFESMAILNRIHYHALFTWILLFCCQFCYFLTAWIYLNKLVSWHVLFVLGCFSHDLSGAFKLTTNVNFQKSAVPERMPKISVSQKLNMSIKGSTVNQKVFPFLFVLLKLEYNTQDPYFYDSAFSNSKET